MKIERNVKLPLNNMVNWREIEKMQNFYCMTWKVAAKASNMPSQDVWKFTPVSYRTSALWGRCPTLTAFLQLITPSRASGTADHVRSLDDLLSIYCFRFFYVDHWFKSCGLWLLLGIYIHDYSYFRFIELSIHIKFDSKMYQIFLQYQHLNDMPRY